MFSKNKTLLLNSLLRRHHVPGRSTHNYNTLSSLFSSSSCTLNFHTTIHHHNSTINTSSLGKELKERAGLNKKELDLFEQLRLDESDLEELKNQITETNYPLATERFNKIITNKCVFIERDESVDLSKFAIKLVEFANSKVPLPTTDSASQQQSACSLSPPKTIAQEAISTTTTPNQSTTISNKDDQSSVVVPSPDQEPSSISAVLSSSNTIEEEEDNSNSQFFQLPTEHYSNWDKETTLHVMKGVTKKGGAGMKGKQIQCLKRLEINGKVLESVRIDLIEKKNTKEIVKENLLAQLSIPPPNSYKPTPSIISKIVDWVEMHSS